MLHAWRTPETLRGTRFAEPVGADGLRFSLLVPARHEQEALEHTVTRLLESPHSDDEGLAIVGHDEPDTAADANRRAHARPDAVRVVAVTPEPKHTPTALT